MQATEAVIDAPPPAARDLESKKSARRAAVAAHARPSDALGLAQAVSTLAPLAILWSIVGQADGDPWILAGATVAIALFMLRVFVLMHDCGHNSLFRTAPLNRGFGFVFGVIAGMPQYVWSKHHAYHHATNGDWSKYTGPLGIVTVDAYLALDEAGRRRYRRARHIANAPLAGLLYLAISPRVNWLTGTARLLAHVARRKLAEPGVPLSVHASSFRTKLWSTPKEYRHMTWNNVALVATWAAMAWAVGPAAFLAVHLAATALAGGAAIVLFTVQHNFEHSYASDTAGWDADDAVTHGTSMLVLPAWLNWFTADIAYHHVHHLSAAVPNYRLARCHAECAAHFTEVRRLTLREVPGALRCILWDTRARRIVSVEAATASTGSR
jgi:omega-6 fatty acid desaturase (delta-12 desaturase)